jgi:glycosyltransferase involved in cell wall biosynthesis
VAGLLHQSLAGPNQRVIFQNPDDLQLAIERLGLDPAKAVLIRGSGVDTTRFTPAPELPHPPVILFVGRLLRDKGVLDFCTAARLAHEKAPHIKFQIAGTPDVGNPSSLQDADVQQISAVQPYLEFLGHVEDMPSCYRKASMAVLPSYGEGVPRSLIEAAACGLPLVSTDVPGCREIVRNQVNGVTVPPRDPQALALAILRLLECPELATSFGCQSRILVESEFSESSVLDRTLSVYRSVLREADLPA